MFPADVINLNSINYFLTSKPSFFIPTSIVLSSTLNCDSVRSPYYPMWDLMLQTMTLLLTLLSASFSMFVVYVSCGNVGFFTWHPICMSVACGFLVFQSIYLFSWKSFFAGSKNISAKVTLHWAIQVIMLSLAFTGFIIVYWNKNHIGKEHFVTWHAKLGLVSMLFLIAQSSGGLMAKYPNFSGFKRPVVIKSLHAFASCITTSLLAATLITGLNSKFFLRLMADFHPAWKTVMSIPVLLVFGVIVQVVQSYLPRLKSC